MKMQDNVMFCLLKYAINKQSVPMTAYILAWQQFTVIMSQPTKGATVAMTLSQKKRLK